MTLPWTCEWCGNISFKSEDYSTHTSNCSIRLAACQDREEPMKTYEDGVRDALADLNFQEANACGFPQPYSAVVKDGPIKRLFALRKDRLLNKETK